MREFFHGWRRKLGCVTLLVACALVAPWTRSYSHVDVLKIPRPSLQHEVESSNGSLHWAAYVVYRPQWGFASRPSDDPGAVRSFSEYERMDFPEWIISYWGLVLSTTAVSAALIFWPQQINYLRVPASMRDFFQGWRRKTGLATLIVAGGLLVLWVRTEGKAAVIDIDNSQSLLSENGRLAWATDHGFEGNPAIVHRWFDSVRSRPAPDSGSRLKYRWVRQWHRGWSGLGYGYDTSGTLDVHWLQIPYWTFVPPLAMLAGYLILWKPQQRN